MSSHSLEDGEGPSNLSPTRSASAGDLLPNTITEKKSKSPPLPRAGRRPSLRTNNAGGTDSGEPGSSSSLQRHPLARFLSVVWAALLRFLTDFLTFLLRGGLGTMMFLMDEVLTLIIAAFSWIPGAIYLGYAFRLVVWLFHLLTWVMYTAVELIFYLPAPLLILYLISLAAIYSYVPESVHMLLRAVVWTAHSFLHLLRNQNITSVHHEDSQK